MNILMANKDGSSSAKVGDYVITGGGIYEKTATGSRFVESLKSYIGSDKTSSYEVVRGIYNNVVGNYSKSAPVTAEKIDDNGIVTVAPVADPAASVNSAAYDPAAYVSTGGSGLSGSEIAGYVIIGLVGLAVLDRFVGGSGK